MKCLFVRIFLLILLLGCVNAVMSQPGDLTQDRDFFYQQSRYYQKWLNASGIGEYLRVKEIEVKQTELSIYLEFTVENFDSIQLAWDLLKETFEAESPLSLEQQLFYKAANLMDIRQSLLNVQIYDTYNLSKEPFFFVGIFHNGSEVRVKEEIGARSASEKITLRPPQDTDKERALVSFRQKFTQKFMFEEILKYAENRYGQTACDERYPSVELIEKETILRFEVMDLCKEVLTDETQPTLCATLRTWGYDCNWVKREMLIFTITYEDVNEGVKLTVDIDGRFGSGFYDEVRRAGYIPMDDDYKDYLERYARRFKTDLIDLFD